METIVAHTKNGALFQFILTINYHLSITYTKIIVSVYQDLFITKNKFSIVNLYISSKKKCRNLYVSL